PSEREEEDRARPRYRGRSDFRRFDGDVVDAVPQVGDALAGVVDLNPFLRVSRPERDHAVPAGAERSAERILAVAACDGDPKARVQLPLLLPVVVGPLGVEEKRGPRPASLEADVQPRALPAMVETIPELPEPRVARHQPADEGHLRAVGRRAEGGDQLG